MQSCGLRWRLCPSDRAMRSRAKAAPGLKVGIYINLRRFYFFMHRRIHSSFLIPNSQLIARDFCVRVCMQAI